MKTNLRTMMLALAALGLFSCSDKLTDDAKQPSADGITDGFITFKISNIGNSTRAGDDDEDFKPGTDSEYKICDVPGANVAYFFGDDKKFITTSNLQAIPKGNGTADANSNVNYSARIRKSSDETIAYCVIILNGDPTELSCLAEKATYLNAFMTTGEVGSGQYSGYFTMSNTIYVKNDGGTYKLQGPTAITADNIYPSLAAAQEADEDKKVTVYVERLVSKFDVDFKNEEGTILNTNNLITYIKENEDGLPFGTEEDSSGQIKAKWGIHVKGWSVNATEKSTYWFKHLNDGSNFNAGDLYPEGTMKTPNFGKWGVEYAADKNGWNDHTRLRSYWAVDPHYNSAGDSYPDQYREAMDESGVIHVTDPANTILNYITYDEIDNNSNTLGIPQYSLENTFAYDWFDKGGTDYDYKGHDYKQTATQVLIAAELLLDDEVKEDGTLPETVSDKYSYENVYWSAKNKAALIKYMATQVLLEYATPLYTDANATTQLTSETEGLADYFDLEDPATIKGGDGRVMLSLKKDLYTSAQTKLSKNEPKLAEVIRAVGTAKHFKEGKMYYAIPIKHMAPSITEEDKTFKYNIGTYGVVRNHWYKVQVTKIEKPGTPVDKPDQPIVPSDEPDEAGYVLFNIVVVPWHTIEQEVEF